MILSKECLLTGQHIEMKIIRQTVKGADFLGRREKGKQRGARSQGIAVCYLTR